MHVLVIGGTGPQRLTAALAQSTAPPNLAVLDASSLPFLRAARAMLPPPPCVLLLEDVHLAFPDNQAGGTRLVLTHSMYLMQSWVDVLDPSDRIVATADRAVLERTAPEALRQRGPWARFEVRDLDSEEQRDVATGTRPTPARDARRSPAPAWTGSLSDKVVDLLVRAYGGGSPAERLGLCREAFALAPESAVAALALAGACREQQDVNGARAALDASLRVAPDWAAAHFEDGKLWMATDDTRRARDAFQRACDLMPTFVAAFGNLGAVLGELDAPEKAVAAFRHALALDPRNHSLLNNMGVVTRELGRLDESEATFRTLLQIAPEFAFGYYNLGHTLLLNGKYAQALGAYEEGQRRDPGKNRRQACRLAMARFACGDLEGATRDFWQAAGDTPADERVILIAEAHDIASALLAKHPDLDPDRVFLAQLERGSRRG